MHDLLNIDPTTYRVEITRRPMQIGNRIINRRVGRERKGENPLGKRIHAVCKTCNETWMSGLENSARSGLESLVRSEAHQLTVAAQKTIAEWLTMKTMVIDADPKAGGAAFLREECEAFKTSRTIPEALRIWITHSNAQEWRCTYEHGVLALSDGNSDAGVGNNVSGVTLGIGDLGVVAFYTRTPHISVDPLDREKMFRIWPASGQQMAWPTKSSSAHDMASFLLIFEQVLAHVPGNLRRTQTPLRVVPPNPSAAVLSMQGDAGFFSGAEPHDLLCGKCGLVLCRGVSVESFRERIAVDDQFLLACPQCGSLNQVPVQGTKPKRRSK